jgi:hypothetical protein
MQTDWRARWVVIGSKILSPPKCADRLWGPPSLLFNGHWGSLPRRWGIWGVRLTTHLSPMLSLQMSAADPPLLLHALMACIRTTLPFTRYGNSTHRMCRFDFYKCRGLLLGGPLCCTLDGVSGHSDSSGSCRRCYCQLRLYQDSCGWSRKVLGRLGRFEQLDVLSGRLLRGRYLKWRLYSSCCCRIAWPQNRPLKVLYTYQYYVNTEYTL